jgi:voltage-gated potassium channel
MSIESPDQVEPEGSAFRRRVWRIVFKSDTPAGRWFDLVLLWSIVASVIVVMLDSVESLRAEWHAWFLLLEWTFTALFTLEYILRLWCSARPWVYAKSFFGLVDLMSVAPNYLSLVLGGSHYLAAVRILRLMRVFRILKMAHHVGEANLLLNALIASRRKIFVFMTSVLALVCVEGTLMYVLEQADNPRFASIPAAVYWAVVTVTTVGYGDVVPVTVAGKVLASFMMMTGFAILAVPTGIVTAEIGREVAMRKQGLPSCAECGYTPTDAAALYCSRCGTSIPHA